MNINSCMAEVRALSKKIGRPVHLMEVCGTHTVSAFRTGLRSLLPDEVELIAGPGCPVCVTPNGYLDRAIAIARRPGAMITTFGDMLRVPGTESSLERERATGANIRIVYSATDALDMAREQPDTRVVFLGVGFETTMPTIAWTLRKAREDGVDNYSVLCAHKTIPEAMAALLASGETSIDGFMCPGHVSVVIGAGAYRPLCEQFHAPCVITGFEAGDMALAIRMLLAQALEGRAEVEIQYKRSVNEDGNAAAQAACAEVFEKCETEWRGVGVIPDSGMRIRPEFAAHDAARIFADLSVPEPADNPGCICGEVLRGVKSPPDCPLFGRACTPAEPIGACMVSSEGSCAAYHKFAQRSTN